MNIVLNRDDWHKQTFEWNDKPFYRVTFASFLGLPITNELQLKKASQTLNNKHLLPGMPVILTRNKSLCTGELLIEVNGPDGIPTERMSGRFFSMFFEGYLNHLDTWKKRIAKECEERGMHVEEILTYFANNRGSKSQTVLLAKVI